MTPEYAPLRRCFISTVSTIDYLTLTGRDEARVKLVEDYARPYGLWVDDIATAEYERSPAF